LIFQIRTSLQLFSTDIVLHQRLNTEKKADLEFLQW